MDPPPISTMETFDPQGRGGRMTIRQVIEELSKLSEELKDTPLEIIDQNGELVEEHLVNDSQVNLHFEQLPEGAQLVK